MSRRRTGGREGERGAALMIVLVAGALMTFVAAVALRSLHAHVEASALFARELAAEDMARAGLDLALAELAAREPAARLRGEAREALNGGTLDIAFVSERARADMNLAPADMLTALFEGAGLKGKAAAEIATAITEARGAATGEPGQTPRFGAPAELLTLPAMTPAAFAAVEPLLSPCSGEATVNPAIAEPPVLLALFAGDRAAAARFADRRKRDPAPDAKMLDALPLAARGFVAEDAEPGPGARIRVDARLGGLLRRYEGVVCSLGADDRLPSVVSWRALS